MLVVRRFGAWRLAVCALAVAAAGSVVAWAASGAPAAAAAVAIAAVAAAAAQVLRIAPFALNWDGSRWWLAQPPQAEPAGGELHVAIDLGAWMLLRFRGEDKVRSNWLPLAAGAAGPAWRSLRAAAHGADRQEQHG